MPPITERWLIEILTRQRVELPPDRAERLRPMVESLLARLARVSAALPHDAVPAPSAVPDDDIDPVSRRG